MLTKDKKLSVLITALLAAGLLLGAIVAARPPAASNASQASDQVTSPADCLLSVPPDPSETMPSKGGDPAYPPGLVIVAGEVQSYSRNLGRGVRGPRLDSGAPSTETCWITLRVAKRLVGAVGLDTITVKFSRPTRFDGVEPSFNHYTQIVDFVGGERLLVVANRRNGGYTLTNDLYCVQTYDCDAINGIEEYVRWSGLDQSRLLDAMSAAIRQQSGNAYLRLRAIDLLAPCAKHAGRRSWAFGVLSDAAKNTADPRSDTRGNALWSAKGLYDIQEKTGVSPALIRLCDDLVSDSSTPLHLRQTALRVLASLGSKRFPKTGVTVFRTSVLSALQRFAASAKDPQLRATAAEERDGLLVQRRRATAMVGD